jgi:hypothetical protein
MWRGAPALPRTTATRSNVVAGLQLASSESCKPCRDPAVCKPFCKPPGRFSGRFSTRHQLFPIEPRKAFLRGFFLALTFLTRLDRPALATAHPRRSLTHPQKQNNPVISVIQCQFRVKTNKTEKFYSISHWCKGLRRGRMKGGMSTLTSVYRKRHHDYESLVFRREQAKTRRRSFFLERQSLLKSA